MAAGYNPSFSPKPNRQLKIHKSATFIQKLLYHLHQSRNKKSIPTQETLKQTYPTQSQIRRDGRKKGRRRHSYLCQTGSESSNINAMPFAFKLNDTNFKVWSRMMEVHAAGLDKLGYLNGKTPKVDEGDPGCSK